LIAALRTDDRRAHTLVVDDLVRVGADAVELLVEALEDANPNVRAGAARALGKIGDQRALGPLIFRLRYEPDAEVRKPLVWALHLGGERAVAPLIDALRDHDEWVRFGAVVVLAKIGTAAVTPLMRALYDADAQVRVGAAETLGRIGDRQALDALADLLHDVNDSAWKQAAVAMGRMGDARAVRPLVKILQGPVNDLFTRAIKALGQIGDVRAVEPLIEIAYSHDDRWVRLFVVEALGKLGDIRAVEVLMDLLDDDSQDVRARVLVALGEIPYTLAQDALHAISADPDVARAEQQMALYELGKRRDPRALDGLVDLLLEDPFAETRMYAALVLGEMNDPRATGALLDALCEDTPDVASHALQSLVKLGSGAVVHLAALYEQGGPVERRVWIARALGEIGTAAAGETLRAIASSRGEHARVRATAIDALRRLDDTLH
jgi:HEAT repeat protein